MNADYMLACGIAWLGMADPEAGWRLVRALESADSQVQALARALLVEGGENSLPLLKSALEAAVVNPETASSCMAEILCKRQIEFTAGHSGSPPTRKAPGLTKLHSVEKAA